MAARRCCRSFYSYRRAACTARRCRDCIFVRRPRRVAGVFVVGAVVSLPAKRCGKGFERYLPHKPSRRRVLPPTMNKKVTKVYRKSEPASSYIIEPRGRCPSQLFVIYLPSGSKIHFEFVQNFLTPR